LEWIYLVLIIAFGSWSIQIFMVYKKQSERIDQQIQVAKTNQEEVTQQAEVYEARVVELATELEELKGKESDWEGKEKAIQRQLSEHQERESRRNPTRHRVDRSDSEA
jgi:hypothetical protein